MQTRDGYLLGLHRLGWRKGEEGTRVNAGVESVKKKVVYLHHGLMMNSEVWVCLTEKERCLPFILVDKGYDVWVCLSNQNLHDVGSRPVSLVTTEATSTPKRRQSHHHLPVNSGISLWISSPFMTFLTGQLSRSRFCLSPRGGPCQKPHCSTLNRHAFC